MSAVHQNLSLLIEDIKEQNGKPVNVRVVSATIESLGIRDLDAPHDYGFENIPALADYIFKLLNSPEFLNLKNKKQLRAEDKSMTRVRASAYVSLRNTLFVKNYSTGLVHLFPIFIQIVAIILYGFSLWTFNGFNKLQSTAVVLGVAIGLISTGGFVQAIGKQVSFYFYNEDYLMTRQSVINLLKLGTKSMLFIFLFIFGLNFFLHLFPFQFVVIVFTYSFTIGFLLLSLAPLYTLKQRWVISVTVTIATFLALSLFLYTNLPIYFIHWISILMAALLSLGYLHYFFKRIIKNNKHTHNRSPNKMLSVYRNFNYFFYGILVYVFVFLDRILAWSSTLDRNIPYLIYYEKDYEIGMDLAILVFFLLAGVLEYSISNFNRVIDYWQRKVKYNEAEKFNRKLLKMYYRHLSLFAITSVFIALFLYLLITEPWGYRAAFDAHLSLLSLKVCIIGSVGYLFFTIGLLNVLYLYTLNRYRYPLRGIALGTLVNLVFGIGLSRIVSYEYSVVGMLIGAIVFMMYTTHVTFRFFKNLDFNYYAAY